MINIPEREQITVETHEERILQLGAALSAMCGSTGNPEAATSLVKTYARTYAAIQLMRVGQEFIRNGNFSTGRTIIEKAEEL